MGRADRGVHDPSGIINFLLLIPVYLKYIKYMKYTHLLLNKQPLSELCNSWYLVLTWLMPNLISSIIQRLYNPQKKFIISYITINKLSFNIKVFLFSDTCTLSGFARSYLAFTGTESALPSGHRFRQERYLNNRVPDPAPGHTQSCPTEMEGHRVVFSCKMVRFFILIPPTDLLYYNMERQSTKYFHDNWRG